VAEAMTLQWFASLGFMSLVAAHHAAHNLLEPAEYDDVRSGGIRAGDREESPYSIWFALSERPGLARASIGARQRVPGKTKPGSPWCERWSAPGQT